MLGATASCRCLCRFSELPHFSPLSPCRRRGRASSRRQAFWLRCWVPQPGRRRRPPAQQRRRQRQAAVTAWEHPHHRWTTPGPPLKTPPSRQQARQLREVVSRQPWRPLMPWRRSTRSRRRQPLRPPRPPERSLGRRKQRRTAGSSRWRCVLLLSWSGVVFGRRGPGCATAAAALCNGLLSLRVVVPCPNLPAIFRIICQATENRPGVVVTGAHRPLERCPSPNSSASLMRVACLVLQKIARAMVKEYIDHERQQAGQSPCAPAQLFRANPQPDWWPQGVEVRSLQQKGIGLQPSQLEPCMPIVRMGACLRYVRGAHASCRCTATDMWRLWPGSTVALAGAAAPWAFPASHLIQTAPPRPAPCPAAVERQGLRHQGHVPAGVQCGPSCAGSHSRRAARRMRALLR